MRAGPYIRAQIKQQINLAEHFRDLARQLPRHAGILLKDAEDAEAEARRWASGTDYVFDCKGPETR